MANSKNITFDQLQAALSRVKSALDGKANTSHGNHVPKTETANNARFLRNDNTWQTITPVNIGAADRSHSHGSYVNQNAFSNIKVGDTTVAADSPTDTLTLTAGANVTLTPDATNDTVTIAAKDTVYTHPTTSGYKHIPSGGSSGQILRWSADGTAAWGSDNNTDTKVTNTLATTTKAYVTGTTSATTNTGTQVFDTGVYLDTTAGKLVATTFAGALSGNASTATSLQTARKFTIGNTERTFNGSGDVKWTLADIGAAAASHNHTSLTGVTKLQFAAGSSDSAVMKVTTEEANTYLDFEMNDDTNTDMYRWRFSAYESTGATPYFNLMTLTAKDGSSARLTVNGDVTASSFTGNASSATKLQTARAIKIGNTSKNFDGTANVTWTLSEIGAAAASHGTHVTWSTTTPKANGTAAVGTETKVARGDHVHPAQTSVSGNAGTATKLATARTLTIGNTGKNFDGSGNVSWSLDEIGAASSGHTHSYIPLSGSASITGNLEFSNSGTTTRGIIGTIGDNDFWRIVGGATATNAGYLEIATADDANEPIYVRQYGSGKFGTLTRTATLLDASGNTSFPGTVTAPAFKGSLNGNASTATKLQTARTLTIGNAGKEFDGSNNVSWTLDEMGVTSAITQSGNSILNTVSNTYTTKDEFNNLKIGGRNYVKNSNFDKGLSYWTTTHSVSDTILHNGHKSLRISVNEAEDYTWSGANQIVLLDVEPNTTVTISCWYYIQDKSTFDSNFGFELKGKIEGVLDQVFIGVGVAPNEMENGVWKRLVATATTDRHWDALYAFPWVAKNGTIYVTDFKIELGNKATDWTPAPEDMNDGITAINNKFADYSTTQQMNSAIQVAENDAKMDIRHNYVTKHEAAHYFEGENKWKLDLYSLGSMSASAAPTKETMIQNNCQYQSSILVEHPSYEGDKYGDNYVGYATTYMHFTEDYQWNGRVVTDDNGNVYLNDVLVLSTSTCQWTNITLNFKAGWNKLEVLYAEGGGGDGWQFDSEIVVVPGGIMNKMNCYGQNSIGESLKENYPTKSELQQATDSITAKFSESGGYNLLRNGRALKGTSYWVDNSGGISVDGGNPPTVDHKYFCSNLPGGMAYSDWVQLENNTHYIYSAKIYVAEPIVFNGIVPLHHWCTADKTAGQSQLSIVRCSHDGQTIPAGQWVDVWVEYLTASSGAVWFKPFIYHSDASCAILVTDLMLCKGSIPKPWSPHPSELYDGITQIDKDGIKVLHDGIDGNSYTHMASTGFYVNNRGEDVLKIDSAGLHAKGDIVATSGSIPSSILNGQVPDGLISQWIKDGATNGSNAITRLNGSAGAWDNAYNRVVDWAYGAVGGTTTINGGLIEANTIAANQIAIGDFTNYSQLVKGKNLTNTQGWASWVEENMEWYSSSSYFPFTSNYTKNIFATGDQVNFDFDLWIGEDKSMAIGVWFYNNEDGDSSYLTASTTSVAFKAGYNHYNVNLTIPTNDNIKKAKSMQILINNNGTYVAVRNVVIRRRVTGNLIVDGSITADKIAANAITGKNISGGTINIGSGVFVVDAKGQIKAKTIPDSKGQYLDMSSSTYKIYKNSGTLAMQIGFRDLTFEGGNVNYSTPCIFMGADGINAEGSADWDAHSGRYFSRYYVTDNNGPTGDGHNGQPATHFEFNTQYTDTDTGYAIPSKFKFYADGHMRISPVRDLEIYSYSNNGEVDSKGNEYLLAKFYSSNSNLYSSALDIPAVINTRRDDGILIVDRSHAADGVSYDGNTNIMAALNIVAWHGENGNDYRYVRPYSDGSHGLGSADRRWGKIYSSYGTVDTSDRRCKTNINYLSPSNTKAPNKCIVSKEDIWNFIKDIDYASYNFIDSETGNAEVDNQFGFILQDLIQSNPDISNNLLLDSSCKNDSDAKDSPLMGYNKGNYINMLGCALQQAMKKIELLEEKIKNIEES